MVICFPLDNMDYRADALGAWCGTRTRGVFSADGHYVATSNNDMTVTLSGGLAWLKADTFWGVVVLETNPQILSFETADGALSRIDAICVRLNKNNNVGEIVVKKGAYSPQPPVIAPPVRNLDYDEIYVATVMIRAGATSILAGDITDQRMNEAYCGIMRDGVTGIPSQDLHDAWVTWFNSFSTNSTITFEDWLQHLQNELDENQAAHLLNLIDQHKELVAASNPNGVHGVRYQDGSLSFQDISGAWRQFPYPPEPHTHSLLASGWTGSSAPYSYRISEPYIRTFDDKVTVDLPATRTSAQETAFASAGIIKDASSSGQGAGFMNILAIGVKPTVDIPVVVTAWPMRTI